MTTTLAPELTQRERELGAIINAYNDVTDQLKTSHERLAGEVRRLREELARKNRQLRRRERLAALGEMAAGVAHEIRNPLGGIQLFASLLHRDLADRPAQQGVVEKITKGVGALESIVANILEFGRPSEPNPTPVRLGRVVGQAAELAEAKSAASGVAVEIAPALERVEVVTDAGLLQQALLNLILNAIEAAGANDAAGAPAVRIDLGDADDWNVAVAIADNGRGIPAELMDRIFNPFFTTKETGTGLGLAIVHQIAETLQGTVQAANRADGGAVFTLCLPRELDAAVL